jgi:hypothetical protein
MLTMDCAVEECLSQSTSTVTSIWLTGVGAEEVFVIFPSHI